MGLSERLSESEERVSMINCMGLATRRRALSREKDTPGAEGEGAWWSTSAEVDMSDDEVG
jgi:hypothetical protein